MRNTIAADNTEEAYLCVQW